MNPIGLVMTAGRGSRLRRIGAATLWAAVSVLNLGGVDQYETLEAGETVYRDVVVRSNNASSLIVTHAGGLAQIPLSSLPAEIQERYGYDGQSDATRRADLDRLRRRQIIESQQRLEQQRKMEVQARLARASQGAGRAIQSFGSPPNVAFEIDLRPKFRELGIGIRSQGRRPSCAIHAVVGALEYLEGRRLGQSENLSEHYLHWATLKTLGRYDQSEVWARQDGTDSDAGFHLSEVFQALRAYGVPNSEESMGLGIDPRSGELEAPTEEIIQKARVRSGIKAFAIPGRDKDILIGNIVHALNAGEPVVVGMGWPLFQAIRRTAYLDGQTPRENYGHAVTFVGYRSPTRRLEDITFVFKNSWGVKWGANGYGYARYHYLSQHLHNAFIMESSES